MLIRKGLDTEKRSSPYSDSRQCDFVWWIGIIQDGCSLPGASPPTVILIAGHDCKCSALRFILSERTGDLIPRYRTGAGFGQGPWMDSNSRVRCSPAGEVGTGSGCSGAREGCRN